MKKIRIFTRILYVLLFLVLILFCTYFTTTCNSLKDIGMHADELINTTYVALDGSAQLQFADDSSVAVTINDASYYESYELKDGLITIESDTLTLTCAVIEKDVLYCSEISGYLIKM